MATSNSYLQKILGTALPGCMEDLRELEHHLAVTPKEASEVVHATRTRQNGKVVVHLRDHSILAIYAAKTLVSEAVAALEGGDIERSAAHALAAQRLILQVAGNALGLQLAAAVNTERQVLSRLSAKALDKRHVESRAMKADVFAWCDENMKLHASMDDAAQAIAGKLVPLKFRAIRSHMTEWRKLQRLNSDGLPADRRPFK